MLSAISTHTNIVHTHTHIPSGAVISTSDWHIKKKNWDRGGVRASRGGLSWGLFYLQIPTVSPRIPETLRTPPPVTIYLANITDLPCSQHTHTQPGERAPSSTLHWQRLKQSGPPPPLECHSSTSWKSVNRDRKGGGGRRGIWTNTKLLVPFHF